jgi:hypothetical protein
MKNKVIIIFLFSLKFSAQDKLFLKNEALIKADVYSISNEFIFIKQNDTSLINKSIPKTDVILIEKENGDIFIFSEKSKKIISEKTEKRLPKRNVIETQPLGFLTGRISLAYERLNKNNTIGFVFPLSLSFDPIGIIYKPTNDSTGRNSIEHIKGFSFISGIDINFYINENKFTQFFVGPRIRYGNDMFLRGIEAFTAQTQFGIKLSDKSNWLIQHISVGFGFVRIFSSPAGTLLSTRQLFAWGSLNYRLGIKW